MAGRFSVEAVFKAIDRTTMPVRRMQARIHSFTRRASASLEKLNEKTSAITEGFSRVAVAGVAATALLAAGMVDVIRTGAEFEKTLMSATARFPGNIRRGTREFEELREVADRVGATTEFNAQQAAGALNVFAAAGFSAQQAIAALPGAGDLATVAMLDLDEAASLAADSLGALNLKTSDAAQLGRNMTRVNDLIAKSTQLANTSATEFAEAIKTGGNAAVSSGASVETFAAMVSGLAASNIKGAEAGTAIRNMFLRLQAPSTKAAAVLRRLHVRTTDAHGNMRDMVDVLGDLQGAMAGMGTAQRTEALSRLFGAETITPAIAMLNLGSDGLRNFRTQLEGANGAAAAMATTMRDTTTGDIDGFTSAIDGVKTAIFGVIAGPLRGIVVALTEWVNKNKELVTGGLTRLLAWCQQAHPVLGTVGKAILSLATGFYTVTAALRIASTVMATFNAIAALNPFVLLAMGIVAAIAAIVLFWEPIKGFFRWLDNGAKAMGTSLSTILAVAAAFASIVTVLRSATAAIAILNGAMRAASVVMGIVNAVMALNPFVLIGIAIVAAIAAIVYFWPQIKAFFTKLGQAASELCDSIGAWFSALWESIASAASEYFEIMKEIWAPIGDFFSSLWAGIANTFSSIVGAVIDKVMGAVNAVRSIAGVAPGSATPPGDDAPPPAAGGQMVTPQDRAARSISETNTTTTDRSEVTIRDETGRAAVTRAPRGNRSGVRLMSTGTL